MSLRDLLLLAAIGALFALAGVRVWAFTFGPCSGALTAMPGWCLLFVVHQ